MKYSMRIIPLAVMILFGSVHLAKAQNASVYFGLGTAIDSSNHQSIDTFGTGNFVTTPRMGGLFESF